MIRFKQGDLIIGDEQAVVIPVNMIGIAGAGLARQASIAFPKWHWDYMRWCNSTDWGIHYFEDEGKIVYSFVTKQHWRNRSNKHIIESGLEMLRLSLIGNNIKSVAIPKLGCGLGRMRWSTVKPLILEALKDLDIDVVIYDEYRRAA